MGQSFCKSSVKEESKIVQPNQKDWEYMNEQLNFFKKILMRKDFVEYLKKSKINVIEEEEQQYSEKEILPAKARNDKLLMNREDDSAPMYSLIEAGDIVNEVKNGYQSLIQLLQSNLYDSCRDKATGRIDPCLPQYKMINVMENLTESLQDLVFHLDFLPNDSVFKEFKNIVEKYIFKGEQVVDNFQDFLYVFACLVIRQPKEFLQNEEKNLFNKIIDYLSSQKSIPQKKLKVLQLQINDKLIEEQDLMIMDSDSPAKSENEKYNIIYYSEYYFKFTLKNKINANYSFDKIIQYYMQKGQDKMIKLVYMKDSNQSVYQNKDIQTTWKNHNFSILSIPKDPKESILPFQLNFSFTKNSLSKLFKHNYQFCFERNFRIDPNYKNIVIKEKNTKKEYTFKEINQEVQIKKISLEPYLNSFIIHPNLIFSYLTFQHPTDKDSFAQVFEHQGKNLSEYLIVKKQQEFPTPQSLLVFTRKVLRIILQTTMAIEQLHQNKIIHSDINPNNILVDDEGNNVVLCDLGASIQSRFQKNNPKQSTRGYDAPEHQQNSQLGYESDLFQLGKTINECLKGLIQSDQMTKLIDNLIAQNMLIRAKMQLVQQIIIEEMISIQITIEYIEKRFSLNQTLKISLENENENQPNIRNGQLFITKQSLQKYLTDKQKEVTFFFNYIQEKKSDNDRNCLSYNKNFLQFSEILLKIENLPDDFFQNSLIMTTQFYGSMLFVKTFCCFKENFLTSFMNSYDNQQDQLGKQRLIMLAKKYQFTRQTNQMTLDQKNVGFDWRQLYLINLLKYDQQLIKWLKIRQLFEKEDGKKEKQTILKMFTHFSHQTQTQSRSIMKDLSDSQMTEDIKSIKYQWEQNIKSVKTQRKEYHEWLDNCLRSQKLTVEFAKNQIQHLMDILFEEENDVIKKNEANQRNQQNKQQENKNEKEENKIEQNILNDVKSIFDRFQTQVHEKVHDIVQPKNKKQKNDDKFFQQKRNMSFNSENDENNTEYQETEQNLLY